MFASLTIALSLSMDESVAKVVTICWFVLVIPSIHWFVAASSTGRGRKTGGLPANPLRITVWTSLLAVLSTSAMGGTSWCSRGFSVSVC